MKRSALIGWGVGSFTSSALVGAVGLLHLRFMTDSLGLAIGLAGMLIVVSKIYDAMLDPVMGVVSDRTRTPWGRHRPYLFGGGLLAALSLVLLFNVPARLSGPSLVAFVAFSLLLFSTAYTMFRIPYLALGRSITQDFNERSKLMTFSVYGSSLGGLAATSAAPYLLSTLGSDRAGHGLVAWILAAMIALGGIVSFLLIDTEDAELDESGAASTRAHLSFKDAWSALRQNKPFQYLMGFKVTMFAGLTLHGAAIPYYTRHVLGASDAALSGIFLAQMIAMMASQFVWVRAARRFGRRNALMTAALMQMAAMLCWYLIPAGHPNPWVQILGAFQGVCGGGIFFGLYTVLTDTMDLSRKNGGGSGQEGVLAGVFVMVEKATAAFGTFVFSTILGIVGYVSAKNAGAAAQPHDVIVGISIAMSVLPAICALVACLFLRKLNLPHIPVAKEPPRAMKTPSKTIGLAAATAVAVAVIALPAWTPARAQAAPTVTVPTKVMIKRIFTRADGMSTMDEVELPRVSGGDGRSVSTRLYATDLEMGISSPGTFMDWHGVTTPRLLMVLTGELEIGLGDGTKQILKPGNIVLVTDTGRGHTSRSIGTVPVSALTLRLPKDEPLKPKLNSCPPNVVAANCVANGVVITRPNP
jgi:sugar (glycoside-pentoside-hexuronide) transporter